MDVDYKQVLEKNRPFVSEFVQTLNIGKICSSTQGHIQETDEYIRNNFQGHFKEKVVDFKMLLILLICAYLCITANNKIR